MLQGSMFKETEKFPWKEREAIDRHIEDFQRLQLGNRRWEFLEFVVSYTENLELLQLEEFVVKRQQGVSGQVDAEKRLQRTVCVFRERGLWDSRLLGEMLQRLKQARWDSLEVQTARNS